MPLQLTPEQEQRIQAIVSVGAYSSPQEAVDAAISAVEIAAASTFEGTSEELESLLTEGLASQELSEAQFWNDVDKETDSWLAVHKPGSRA